MEYRVEKSCEIDIFGVNMMRKNKVLTTLASNIEEYVSAILLFLMFLVAFINVLSRYLLKASLAFIEEVEVNFFVWVTLLGIAIAFKRGSHLSMNFLKEKAPQSIQKFLTTLGLVLSLSVFIVVIYLTSVLIYREITVYRTSSMALDIPMWVYYTGMLLCSLAVTARITQRIIRVRTK